MLISQNKMDEELRKYFNNAFNRHNRENDQIRCIFTGVKADFVPKAKNNLLTKVVGKMININKIKQAYNDKIQRKMTYIGPQLEKDKTNDSQKGTGESELTISKFIQMQNRVIPASFDQRKRKNKSKPFLLFKNRQRKPFFLRRFKSINPKPQSDLLDPQIYRVVDLKNNPNQKAYKAWDKFKQLVRQKAIKTDSINFCAGKENASTSNLVNFNQTFTFKNEKLRPTNKLKQILQKKKGDHTPHKKLHYKLIGNTQFGTENKFLLQSKLEFEKKLDQIIRVNKKKSGNKTPNASVFNTKTSAKKRSQKTFKFKNKDEQPLRKWQNPFASQKQSKSEKTGVSSLNKNRRASHLKLPKHSQFLNNDHRIQKSRSHSLLSNIGSVKAKSVAQNTRSQIHNPKKSRVSISLHDSKSRLRKKQKSEADLPGRLKAQYSIYQKLKKRINNSSKSKLSRQTAFLLRALEVSKPTNIK